MQYFFHAGNERKNPNFPFHAHESSCLSRGGCKSPRAPAAPGLFCNQGHGPSGARSLPGSLGSSRVCNFGAQRPGTGPGPFSPADGGVALLPPPCRLPVAMLGRLGLGAGMGAGQLLSLEGGKWGFWGGEAAPLLGTQGQMVPSQLGKGTPGWPSALWAMAA